jgi:Tfp pilus assembly protein PilO
MRVRNIIDYLASRWVILTIISWAIIIVMASNVISFHSQNETLGNQKVELTREIEILTQKKDYIEAGREQFKFLKDKKLSIILSDLLSASNKSGAMLGETEIGELISHDNYQSLPITISVKGSYNQIGTFINLFENNLQFQISDINLSTKESKGSGIICRIKAEFIII